MLNGNLVIHEQKGKLGEKDKVIANQRIEIDCLEKKSQMLEFKCPAEDPKTELSVRRCIQVRMQDAVSDTRMN
ncbi:hypothetical protein MATL_G00094800 [Megalops atlanticus]|uniref:Uncharacterized protein n=1 Tax=Megalops atlanticus TaxID=7932 RepID=A0A9D3Q3A3_MEGAT|nr:hypothetical protein MATL_G00094800 [Megalops atlanticus]